jgi:thioredoxin reductase
MPKDSKSPEEELIYRNGRSGAPGAASLYDVVIVGGGPSGLSAALVLGRCRRRVLVIDAGEPRNAAARAIHGYLGRDGTAPREFLRLGREEAARYGVEFLDGVVDSARETPETDAQARAAAFEVVTEDGRRFRSRKLLLATGVRDVLPAIEGALRYYGRGVHHCPYCDGWEYREGALAACGDGNAAVGLALSLRTWSSRVTACTDGTPVDARDRDRLARNGIALRTERIARLEGGHDLLRRIVFENSDTLECDALFFNTEQVQRSALPAMLGCEPKEKNLFRTRDKQRTCKPGLFLAGDADGDVQFVIVAAAEGARAATAINRELQDEDRGERKTPSRARHARA